MRKAFRYSLYSGLITGVVLMAVPLLIGIGIGSHLLASSMDEHGIKGGMTQVLITPPCSRTPLEQMVSKVTV